MCILCMNVVVKVLQQCVSEFSNKSHIFIIIACISILRAVCSMNVLSTYNTPSLLTVQIIPTCLQRLTGKGNNEEISIKLYLNIISLKICNR